MKEKKLIRLDNPRAWRTYIGGELLDELHGKKNVAVSHFPEEWIISLVSARNAGREGIPDEGMSRVPDCGKTLKALIEEDPAFYLGKKASVGGADLGVLVKLIDSAERLTVQVHPDKQKARELFHSEYGKTECWHILGGREIDGEEPCVYFGFKPGIERSNWEKLFEKQDIPGMLAQMQRIPVSEGDTILITGGIPHAIGAGCFLVEIQEPTDYTIRIERTTPSGFQVDDRMCHQGLGFEKMFDCFHYEGMSADELRNRFFIPAVEVLAAPQGRLRTLIGYDSTELFKMQEILAEGEFTLPAEDSFHGLYVIDGGGTIRCGENVLRAEKTAQFFVPAGCGSYTICPGKGERMRVLRFFGPKK